MSNTHPRHMRIRRNPNKAAMKAGLLFGGITLMIVAAVVMSLDINGIGFIDPQLSCFQSTNGLSCKLN